MEEAPAIAHLEVLRNDARDEIKRRIEQRDKYSIQMTISLAAVIGVAVSKGGEFQRALIVAPLVALYFTVLILYSYRIHALLARYLRDQIEPQLARLCGTPLVAEWENYYKGHAVPGIRRSFFLTGMWIVDLGSMGYLWFSEDGEPAFRVATIVTFALYTVGCATLTWKFWKN
ncbi:MAG TPA: hypothetical protein VF017_11225 [Thermoanaerobaculia bacterium]|nr:hypothetical protein [Thermoanaerobaculia bacterium]